MRHALALLILLLAGTGQVAAQLAPATQPQTAARATDRTTRHATATAGAFTAAVETMRLPNAEIVTTAFWQDGAAPPAPPRPVTFAVNGGPGAASAWLDLGAIGPWRVDIRLPVSPSQDPTPVENEQSWLPFTDLVFIDPPGTGFSRAIPDTEEGRRPLFTLDGDIQLLAAVVQRWLEAHHRIGSPVFIAGESYGGFRAPRLARALLDRHGVGVRGLALISPVLDFNGRDATYDPVRWAARLPSLAAAALQKTTGQPATREQLAEAEAYAAGEYLTDLVRGPNDTAALDRLVGRTAGLTGLDQATLRRRLARPDFGLVLRDEATGQRASPYDATIASTDPFPESPFLNSPDPVLDGLKAPVTAGMLMLYRRLDWQPEGPPRDYALLSDSVFRAWDLGRGNNRPESMTALRQYLALDPAAKVLITHGITDLVTPYFATAMLLNQVPTPSPAGRLALRVYPGGHMAYLARQSRTALMEDARRLMAPEATPDGPGGR